jgi:hypothetical protein
MKILTAIYLEHQPTTIRMFVKTPSDATTVRFDAPLGLNEISVPWNSLRKEKGPDGIVSEKRQAGSLSIPSNAYVLFNAHGSPLVGAVYPKNLAMSKGFFGSTPFPLVSALDGIVATPNYEPAEVPGDYWLIVNNQRRQSKWRKTYYDDL